MRVEKIALLDFLKDLPEIVESIPELDKVQASGISLTSPRGNISMSRTTDDSFNMSCNEPLLLEKLTEAMKRFFEKKTSP